MKYCDNNIYNIRSGNYLFAAISSSLWVEMKCRISLMPSWYLNPSGRQAGSEFATAPSHMLSAILDTGAILGLRLERPPNIGPASGAF